VSAIDIAIAIALALATAVGYYWGLLRQVIALSGLLVGVLAARRLGPTVGGWLTSFLGDDRLATALGFGLVLLAVGALSSLVASALRLYVGLLFLGRADHGLGAGLGLFKALLSCALLLALLASGGESWQAWVLESRVGAALLEPGAALLGTQTKDR
jgi:membrane protein required for colicin V production